MNLFPTIGISIFLVLSCSSLSGMTLEEKVGQVLVVHFNGEGVNEDASALVQQLHVGGVIYYNWANGLHSPEQVSSLSVGLQQLAKVPLFIAVDQEGGAVTRLQAGFTSFPGNRALGMAGDPQLAEQCAFVMGQELRAVGVNLNLAPVVDVNSNPRNPVIGNRSFGETPEIVISCARSALQGYHRAGIMTCLKHFPGHGDVQVDSHEGLPIVNTSIDEMQFVELLPFKKLAPLADSVMTAHLLVPAIDPLCCVTLSSRVLSVLRDEIGFAGVVISDSLVMEGVLTQCASIEEAAIDAFNAGCDLLMLGGRQLVGVHAGELTVADVKRIHQALVHAVRCGRISHHRLDEAVHRILSLKGKYDLHLTCHQFICNHDLAKEVAMRALRVIEKGRVGPLCEQKIALFTPEALHRVLGIGKETRVFAYDQVEAALAWADVVIVCSYNAWKDRAQASLMERLINCPLILIVTGDPLDEELCPQARIVLKTFSPSPPSLQAAYDYLTHIL